MTGICITTGLVAFALFAIYDINSVGRRLRMLRPAFFTGLALLVIATAGLLYTGLECRHAFTILALVFALIFLALLIYTLFFALPFSNTYVNDDNREVYTEGVYALCRHPGILWFVGLYAALALAFPKAGIAIGFTSLCICNVLYALMQDAWTFPKYFADYDQYKTTTPLLMPTARSIRRCFETLRPERKS